MVSLLAQMAYSVFDAGNFFVIPGSPAEACKADSIMVLDKNHLLAKMGYGSEDVVITIVGSQFLYRGLWLEHSIVLRAVLPLLEDFPLDNNSYSHLKIIVLSGDSTSNYSSVVEVCICRLVQFVWGRFMHLFIFLIGSLRIHDFMVLIG